MLRKIAKVELRIMIPWHRFAVSALILVIASSVRAGDPAPKPRAERLKFDAKQSQWVELPPPQPGTAEGDLALAQAMLTDERFAEARKAMKAWVKTYGANDIYYPAALLNRARIEKALRNYYQAYLLLDELLVSFRMSEAAEDAVVELFNIAEVFLSGVKRKVWGMRILDARDLGIEILDRISADYNGTDVAELAIKAKADYFYGRGDFALAEFEFGRLANEYPISRYVRYAMRRGADSALASFRGVAFDDAPLVESEERYRLYARAYPGLAEQEGIGLILQNIRERRAGKELETAYFYRRTKHTKAAAFYLRSVVEHWPGTVAARRALGDLERMGMGVAGSPPTVESDARAGSQPEG